jgi:plastocyanin
MSNGDLFYVFGIALAVSAVLVSLFGLRSEKFPGRAFPLVVLWFVALVGGATTFAVLHAKDEDRAKAAEFAAENKKITTEESGPGGTLKLSANPTQLAFNTTKLTSKPGKVTIDFTNPAAIEHDVAIEQNGKKIATSPLISKGETSVTANLASGTYTFLCTVPGHADAGMEGTLIVK